MGDMPMYEAQVMIQQAKQEENKVKQSLAQARILEKIPSLNRDAVDSYASDVLTSSGGGLGGDSTTSDLHSSSDMDMEVGLAGREVRLVPPEHNMGMNLLRYLAHGDLHAFNTFSASEQY